MQTLSIIHSEVMSTDIDIHKHNYNTSKQRLSANSNIAI